MRIRTTFVGVDAHIDPCSRHNRFYETLRQKRTYPTGGQGRSPLQNILQFRRTSRNFAIAHRRVDVGIDPYGDFALSPFVVQFCDCILRGRGRTPPLRLDKKCNLNLQQAGGVEPRPYVMTKPGGRFCFDFRPERW